VYSPGFCPTSQVTAGNGALGESLAVLRPMGKLGMVSARHCQNRDGMRSRKTVPTLRLGDLHFPASGCDCNVSETILSLPAPASVRLWASINAVRWGCPPLAAWCISEHPLYSLRFAA
jgi:hypothetical protein